MLYYRLLTTICGGGFSMTPKWLKKEVMCRDGRLSPVAKRLTGFFSLPSSTEERHCKVSEEGLQGEYRQIFLGNDMQIAYESMDFDREMRIATHSCGDAYALYFSLSPRFQWTEELSGKDWMIDADRFLFVRIREAVESALFTPRNRSMGLSLAISSSRMERFIGSELESTLEFGRGCTYSGRSLAVTDRVRRALMELQDCPLRGTMRLMYLEAKVLELFSLILEQAMGMSSLERNPSLTRTERQCVEMVKATIDENISRPSTIKDLARKSGINECSLKRAFKSLYGQPIHSYIIDRRMGMAYRLLERGENVRETAFRVGYNDASSFSRAFKRKYGCNPAGIKAMGV